MDPAYTYATYHSQYTVNNMNVPRRYNKYIPDPRINSEGQLTMIMIVTVDLKPKYSIIDIRPATDNQHDENLQPQNVPMSSRLGPPVQRSFQTFSIYKISQQEPRTSPAETSQATRTPKTEPSATGTLSNKNKRALKPKNLHF